MPLKSKQDSQAKGGRSPYEKPRVIFRDTLQTRAGSPLGSGPNGGTGDFFDPANLFGNQ